MRKRGQVSGGDVATLLLLTALFILMYMLFIPPSEREKLLPKLDEEINVSTARISVFGKTLLAASPGEVFAFSKDRVVREISTVALFSREIESRIQLASSLTVSRGILQSNSRTLRFNINTGNLKELSLFFFIKDSRGEISIDFNGNRIFDGLLSSRDSPIELPINLVRPINEIVINSESFNGRYELSNVYIRQVSIEENKKATRSFVLTPSEKSGLKRATLFYFLNCRDIENVGNIRISLNNNLISEGLGVCDVRQQNIEIAKEKLRAGTNVIDLEIDKGDYSIEDIELELELSESVFPKYRFDIGDDDFRDIFLCVENEFCIEDCDLICDTRRCFDECVDDCDLGECKNAILELVFEDRGRKKATLTINEFEINFDTEGDFIERDITSFLHRGSNSIKIVPRTTFEISSLRVFIE